MKANNEALGKSFIVVGFGYILLTIFTFANRPYDIMALHIIVGILIVLVGDLFMRLPEPTT